MTLKFKRQFLHILQISESEKQCNHKKREVISVNQLSIPNNF